MTDVLSPLVNHPLPEMGLQWFTVLLPLQVYLGMVTSSLQKMGSTVDVGQAIEVRPSANGSATAKMIGGSIDIDGFSNVSVIEMDDFPYQRGILSLAHRPSPALPSSICLRHEKEVAAVDFQVFPSLRVVRSAMLSGCFLGPFQQRL